MMEFYKTVAATMNGKPIKVTNEQLFAASLVKDGITKGPQSKARLAGLIERLEAQLAARSRLGRGPKRRSRPIRSIGTKNGKGWSRSWRASPVVTFGPSALMKSGSKRMVRPKLNVKRSALRDTGSWRALMFEVCSQSGF